MLERFLAEQVFSLFLVFVRMGAAFATLPGMAEAFVAMRFRLLLAGAVAVVLAPVVASSLPPVPATPLALAVLVVKEAAIGLFIGLSARMIVAAAQTAGTIIGLQSSLANAFAFDPGTAQQGVVTGAWMGSIALVLIFVTDLHHVMLRALVDSYELFRPADPLPVGDIAEVASRLAAASFALGLKMAAPFIAFGFLFYVALGLVARLMPQVQVFFVALPLQTTLGLIMLGASVAFGMSLLLDGVAEALSMFLAAR